MSLLRPLGPYRLGREVTSVECDGRFADIFEPALVDLETDAAPTTEVRVERRTDGWVATTTPSDREPSEAELGEDDSFALHRSLSELDNVATRSTTDDGRAVLHGALVEIDGAAIAVVGPSGMGKSTFTAFAAAAGHRFLADEVVGVGDDLSVLPYPRPIGLRAGAAERLGVDVPEGPYRSVFPYRLATGRGSLLATPTLSLIVILDRADDVHRAELQPLRPIEALLRFTNQTLGSEGQEPEMFARLDRLVRRVPVVEARYREALDAINGLQRHMPWQPSHAG